MANFANVSTFGNPLSQGWVGRNLVGVTAPNGQSWQVHREAAPYFQGLIDDLVKVGYFPKSSGGYNYRNIRGGSQLSQHAFGNAIDIGAAANALGQRGHDFPTNIAELAAKNQLEWGGLWKGRPDPMHFEWRAPNGKVFALPGDAQPGAGGTATAAMPYANGKFALPGAPLGPQQGAPALPQPPPRPPEQSPLGQLASGLANLGSSLGLGAPVAAQPAMEFQRGPVGLGGPAYRPLGGGMGAMAGDMEFAPTGASPTLAGIDSEKQARIISAMLAKGLTA